MAQGALDAQQSLVTPLTHNCGPPETSRTYKACDSWLAGISTNLLELGEFRGSPDQSLPEELSPRMQHHVYRIRADGFSMGMVNVRSEPSRH